VTIDDAAAAALAVIGRDGVAALLVDDLVEADLDSLHWSGGVPHVASMRDQLVRMADGDVEYLVARAPDGTPVAKAGIDFGAQPGAGTIWQVAVHERLQGRGLGTRLIELAEARIRARRLVRAALSVEVDNPRARALYERLGYVPEGERETGWLAADPDGVVGWHSTTVTDLYRPL
jgi:GNAT superfamily N-acetyltransferase